MPRLSSCDSPSELASQRDYSHSARRSSSSPFLPALSDAFYSLLEISGRHSPPERQIHYTPGYFNVRAGTRAARDLHRVFTAPPKLLNSLSPVFLIPQSLARHIETFAYVPMKLMQLTVVSQLSDIHIAIDVKYLRREIPEILAVISPAA